MDVIGKNREREIDKINLFSESTTMVTHSLLDVG